jgi:hypothetical protein
MEGSNQLAAAPTYARRIATSRHDTNLTAIEDASGNADMPNERSRVITPVNYLGTLQAI